MSTILDALKKSEQERKSAHLPTLSDMPAPQERSRWPIIVIAVLSLVLALVIGILLSPLFTTTHQTRAEGPSMSANEAEIARIDDRPLLHAVSPATELVVNVVSYSEVPSQRFVVLNGKMYREKDFVQAGLKVEEIKVNAVVFNERGELITRTP